MKIRLFILAAFALLAAGCGNRSSERAAASSVSAVNYAAVEVPQFCADSAFQYVADQLAFGFRTPDSRGQQQCADYLVRQMSRWCDTVVVQPFTATLWNGTAAHGKNIIASLEAREGTNAEGRRVLFAAHWDSRLWADHDPAPANTRKPLPGANDGASGVATLMEMARVMCGQRPSVSVDFIFFDLEDQGQPEWCEDYQEHTWCLGSQHWAAHPHTPYYRAVYGVLLDMVGSEQPRFTKEQFSMQYAGGIMNKMWAAAAALGHGNIFVNQQTDPILDDHLYVNRMASFPMLDIVQNSPQCSFCPTWHTVNDDLEHISRQSMAVVAEVVMKTLYGDYK